MVRFYDILSEATVEEAVLTWCDLKDRNGRDVAFAHIFQTLVDCLTECSLNASERCRWPMNCTEERASELIEQVIQRRFLARDNENMHQKLAQFLYDLLGKTGTVVWTQGVITILKLCSENGVTVIFAARIAVKLFEALVKLVYCVKRDALANMALDAQAHANQVRFLADRCSGMVDILITCLKYKKTSSIVAQALFPSMQRKAYMLQIDRIGELFCGKCKDFNLQAVTTLKLLVNRGENMDVQQRVLAICTSPAVIQHFERVMQESTWKRLTRLTYELAIDIQEFHPERKIFSNAVLEQVFDSDFQANGIAKLIGQLMYLTEHDPNDVKVFYQRYTEFYAKHKKNDNSCKYMIEACPNTDIFTDWPSIFKYIDGIRRLPGNENHIKNLCHIVVGSAKYLKDRINNETAVDGVVEVQREKLKQLVKLLPKYLRHYQANHEIIGELLYVYKHIDSEMHLQEMEHTKLLLRIINRNLHFLTDFDTECNAVALFTSFQQIWQIDFGWTVGKLHEDLQSLRKKFPTAVTELDWSEITLGFMRFAALSYLDTDLEPPQFDHVAKMCSSDLMVENTYADKQNIPLFGYNLIMLSSCYRLAGDTKLQLPASTPNINQFKAYLLNILDRLRAENDVGFVAFATFTSLCKLFLVNVDPTNVSLVIERPEACVHEMTQFAFAKLISINGEAGNLEHTWPNLAKMFEELSDCCLEFAQDSDLIATVVQYCLQHRLESRKQIGIRFLRASLGKDMRFFGRVVAKVLWDMPRIVSKHALISKLKEMIAEELQANQIAIQKVIAEDVTSRRYLLNTTINGNHTRSVIENANESLRLAVNLVRDCANLRGSPIDIRSDGSDGVRRRVRIDPGDAVARPLRRRQQRRQQRRAAL